MPWYFLSLLGLGHEKNRPLRVWLLVLIMLIRSGFHFFSFDGDSEIDPKSSILFWQKNGREYRAP